MLFVYLVCIVTGIVVLFFKYSLRRRNYSKLVPSVTPHFFNIFGDVLEIIKSENRHIEFIETLTRRSKMFRKDGLMCFWLSYVPVLFPLKANAVKEVLKEKRLVEKGWIYQFLKSIVGEGLLTSPEKKWKVQKRLLAPCFHIGNLRNYMSTFNEEAENLVADLQGETKEDFTIFHDKICLCVLDIASESIFGGKLGEKKDDNVQYVNSFRRYTDIFMWRTITPWMWPDIVFWNTKLGKEMAYHQTKMHNITRSIIAEKRNRYLKGERITLQGKRKAMMDMLLEKHFETQELSEEDIREQIDLFLLAGHDTVTTSITWALFLLGHHPEIQAKVQEELDRVFENDRDRCVTEEDLKDLQYLDCVLKESLRIYPAVPIFAREVSEDTYINGFPVSKGTTCAVYVYGLHRDEDVFPDPEKFDPDRFSAENRANIPECAFIPFAAGPRNCIGYRFAEIEMRTITAWILRNFTVESLDTREEARPIMNISLQSSIPIRIRIRSRFNPNPA